jgi:hypothetical protein
VLCLGLESGTAEETYLLSFMAGVCCKIRHAACLLGILAVLGRRKNIQRSVQPFENHETVEKLGSLAQ